MQTMKIAYFALTQQGAALAGRLAKMLPGAVVTKDTLKAEGKSFADKVAGFWGCKDGLVFIMASGIVVRTIAPLLKSKTTDPAVVVMDGAGHFAISLLSGHLGGANELAIKLSALSGAQAVITTGTDVAGTVAFDVFAKKHQCRIENIEALKFISSAMIEGGPVGVFSTWEPLPDFPGNVRGYFATPDICREAAGVFIGHPYDEKRFFDGRLEAAVSHLLVLRPKNLYIGAGCKKNTDSETMAAAFEEFLIRNQVCVKDVAGLATIELKRNEPAIRKLCERYGLKLVIIEKEKIQALEAEGAVTASEFVRKTTGVGSVCEGCALAAAVEGWAHFGKTDETSDSVGGIAGKMAAVKKQARLICQKTKYTGITFAMAEHRPWQEE